MKKIIIAISLMASTVSVFAGGFGYTARSQASHPFAIQCSTSTATKLFTDDGSIIDVVYDNQSAYSIAIASYPATVQTGGTIYIIPASRTTPLILKGACHMYGISIGTTPATLNGIVEQ